jgi:hypothetical protein
MTSTAPPELHPRSVARLLKPWPWALAFAISAANIISDLPFRNGVIVYRLFVVFVGLAVFVRLVGLLLGALWRWGSTVIIWPRK